MGLLEDLIFCFEDFVLEGWLKKFGWGSAIDTSLLLGFGSFFHSHSPLDLPPCLFRFYAFPLRLPFLLSLSPGSSLPLPPGECQDSSWTVMYELQN